MERTRLSLERGHWLTTAASARDCASSASMRPLRSNGSLRQGAVWSRQSTNCLPVYLSDSTGGVSDSALRHVSRQAKRASARRNASDPASSFRWNHRSKARERRRLASGSVSSSKSGSMRASTGRSRRICAQKPWMVPMAASSRRSSASSRCARSWGSAQAARALSSSSRSRISSSPAALWVKVTATIWCTGVPVANTRTMRRISSEVLPVPAEASTIRLSPRELRMRSRATSLAV